LKSRSTSIPDSVHDRNLLLCSCSSTDARIAAAQHFHIDFTVRIFSGPKQVRCQTSERALKWALTSSLRGATA
jgi:hypothetical protein